MTIFRILKKVNLAGLFFLLFVPMILHLAFSWMGFSLTDEGFTLSYSRRLLEGQIPHLDFIAIRPVLSPLLHTPLVYFGGSYTFWLSRFFVWFEVTLIAWCWVSIINKQLNFPFSLSEKIFIALLSLEVSMQKFPIMPWHTIDGLLFVTIGLYICVTARKDLVKASGYMIIAFSYLCKQNYILIAPLILIVLNDWRVFKFWLAVMIPGILYLLFLLISGALSDAMLQLFCQTDIIQTGITNYVKPETFLGIILGFIFIQKVVQYQSVPVKRLNKKTLILLVTVSILGAAPLLIGLNEVLNFKGILFIIAFFIFGILLGNLFYLYKNKSVVQRPLLKIIFIVLLIAWSSSISIGYNAPILMLGQMVTLILAYVYKTTLLKGKWKTITLYFGLVSVTAIFLFTRINYIYLDQKAENLTRPVDSVIAGAKFIQTNNNTYSYLLDLRSAVKIAKKSNKNYTVIPSAAAYWVKATELNPLSIDWMQKTELPNSELYNRIIEELNTQRNSEIEIVSKYWPEKLATEFTPIQNDDKFYSIVGYIRKNFSKIKETKYFELYK